MKSKYEIYNFPISYIPKILENTETLRNECIDFGLIYASRDDNADEMTIKEFARLYGVTIPNLPYKTNKARELMRKFRNYPEPLTYCFNNALWRFLKCDYEEIELMSLALLLALRSIGKKQGICRTNMQMIAHRMCGRSRPDKRVIRKDVKKWLTRRRFAAMKKLLQERKLVWFIPGHSRGVRFSFEPPAPPPDF